MSTTATDEKLGLYLSVPFCRAKCSFCNFASGVGSDAALERYLDTLQREIASARADAARLGALLPEHVDTIYFGGGTPSLLNPVQIHALFAAIRRAFVLGPGAEITLEAAPGQIADDTLEACQQEGVNRISLGVQSFVDRESAAVGRLHTGDDCLREFARLRAAGVADIGADLIAGLPHQTHASWQHSLQAIQSVGLTHVSIYMLEVDEDSRLGREVLAGGQRFSAPHVASEELAAELYEHACESLPDMGFAQYEISNFARDGFQSRHNRKYWQRAPYLGLGLDAHSMLRRSAGGDLRLANTDELGSYGLASRTVPQIIDEDAAFEESLFLGLRLLAGVSVSELQNRFGPDRVEAVRSRVRELAQTGLMLDTENTWRLTTRGRLVSNEIFGELLASAV